MNFSVICPNVLSSLVQKTFFENLAQKARTPKTHQNRGFGKPPQKKQLTVKHLPILDKNKIRNSSCHFLGSFLLFEQQKTQTIVETLVL